MKIHSFTVNLCRVLLLSAGLVSMHSCSGGTGYVSVSGYAQGGTYIVKLDITPAEKRFGLDAYDIKEGIDSILTQFDNSVSGYNKNSLLSRFNAGEKVVPDEVFTQLYRLSRKYYDMTGGSFEIESEPGRGTRVTARFVIDSIDRAPLGDISDTAVTLLGPDIDVVWVYTVIGRSFTFDTREIKAELGDIPIDSPEIISFLRNLLKENIDSINGGTVL